MENKILLLAREDSVVKPSNGTVLTVKRDRTKLTPEVCLMFLYYTVVSKLRFSFFLCVRVGILLHYY